MLEPTRDKVVADVGAGVSDKSAVLRVD